MPHRMPDGSVRHLRVWGDEFSTIVESLDGYTLTRDPQSGELMYAALSPDGTRLISTGIHHQEFAPTSLGVAKGLRPSREALRRQSQQARLQRAELTEAPGAPRAPNRRQVITRGAVRGILLLVDFNDDVGSIAPAELERFVNQPGYNGYGNNGSVRDYFHDVSDGLLTYTHHVPTAYYRAAQSKLYYVDRHQPFGIRARQLVLEALTHLESSGFDFSQFDVNADGVIDGLTCLYAGYRQSAWGDGLWPHSWTIDFAADGVFTGTYAIMDLDDAPRLSTFCHENGHMLFDWPDLYDYGFDSNGVGSYCLMSGSQGYTSPFNIQEPCAYLKYVNNWAQTTILSTPQSGLTLPAGINRICKYPHPTLPTEYFLIENRTRLQRDAGLPDSGLAVWHVDELGNNDDQQMTPEQHYQVTLVQADGRWDLERDLNVGDDTDLWHFPTHTLLTPSTNPNSNWWNGAASLLHLRDISAPGPVMTFTFDRGPDCNGNSIPDIWDIESQTSQDCNYNLIPDECDVASGLGTDCNTNGRLDSCELTGNDCNGDGVFDACELAGNDCNGNGLPDDCELVGHDCNHNSVPDACELPGQDCNSDGLLDECQLNGQDCNHNGRLDLCDLSSGGSADCNGNSRPDECDLQEPGAEDCQPDGIPDECQLVGNDCNANGIPDACELAGNDCNGNGLPDGCELVGHDCNHNSVPDACELPGQDCNSDGLLDECQLNGQDCNHNGRLDPCDLSSGGSADCNGNSRPDECDLQGPGAEDCQPDGIPDECQLVGNDCNANGIPDACDIALRDCNANGIPDDCELVGHDCNHNSVLDSCEIAGGLVPDCNLNEIPDSCDLTRTTSFDCDANGIPDECELVGNDCNGTGVPDFCELAGNDCDQNGRPDECDAATSDCNGNHVPDICELAGSDCNANGVLDSCDLASGAATDCDADNVLDLCQLGGADCDANGVLDRCELALRDCDRDHILDACQLAGNDCDGNAVLDRCELAGADCDGNGILDRCELIGRDCDHNSVPDVCELTGADCDANGQLDRCELLGADCNANLILDRCELAGQDCDSNGVLDGCELAGSDCDSNGILDRCELAGRDCNRDGVLDACQVSGHDCNTNSVLDVCDITSQASRDCNRNGVPDECDLASGAAVDGNSNGVLDMCEPTPCSTMQSQRILPLDGSTQDFFGIAIASSGDTIVVGASGDRVFGDRSGSAYALRHDGTRWVQEAKLTPSTGVAHAFFGDAVAVDGEWALIGAFNDTGTAGSGSAYVFQRQGGVWVQSAVLRPADGAMGDFFGDSLALVGNFAFVGSPQDGDRGPNSGSVYVFEKTGSTWVMRQKLTAGDGAAYDFFGSSIAVADQWLAVGAYGDDDFGKSSSGSVYFFEKVGTSWTQRQKIAPAGSAAGDQVGFALAARPGWVFAGAHFHDSAGSDAGAAYAFRLDGAQWTLQQKLVAPDAGANDWFGYGMQAHGDAFICGAINDDDRGADAGAAYVYRLEGGVWIYRAKLLPSGSGGGEAFGRSIAFDGVGSALVGAYGYAGAGARSGAVYAFVGAGSDCDGNFGLDACDLAVGTGTDGNGNRLMDRCEFTFPGDFNRDGWIDLADYAPYLDCAAGPQGAPLPLSVGADVCLAVYDMDADGDVDLGDYAIFTASFDEGSH